MRHSGEKRGVEAIDIHSQPCRCFSIACGGAVYHCATVAVVTNSRWLDADNIGKLSAQSRTKALLLGPKLFHAEQKEARYRNKPRDIARPPPWLAHTNFSVPSQVIL